MTTKENLVKAPAKRARRNPVEGRNRLKIIGTDPNYHYRVVNDVDDRINTFLDMGYEFDTNPEIRAGDSYIDENSKLGKVRRISLGGGVHGILMRIRLDWYNEDQEAKAEYVNRTELAMRPTTDGQYGKIEVTRK